MTFTPSVSLTLLHIDFVNIFSNGRSSRSPANKPRVSVDAPVMIDDSLMKTSASHTSAEEQSHEADASNLDATFGEVDDIPIEDLISVASGPQEYNPPPNLT